MQPTVYQKPELRDANDNIIQQGAFGKNTALANSTNDGWIDYVANDLEFLYDLAKDEVVPVPSLPASGQTNKTYLLTTTGVSYRWSGTEWVAVSSSEAVGRAESAANLAEQWATKTDGTVDGTEYSAKYYAQQAEASADDAQDVADDMAIHLVQIDKNTGGVAKNSKRISNIEKLLQGNLYDYDTDDDVAYTKTVPSGALPYAGVEQIGGKTLVWNQLMPTISEYSVVSGSTDGLTITITDNTLNVVGTTTSAVVIQTLQSAGTIPANHKLFLRKSGSGSGSYNWGRAGFALQDNDAYIQSHTVNFGCAIRIAFASDTTYNFTAQFNVTDLTLMFGSGNEPSTVAEFEAMFPADYYPYNAGALLSAGVTEVESVGKNLAYYGDGLGVPSNTAMSNATKRIFEVGKYIIGLTYNNYYDTSRVTQYDVTDNVITVTSANIGYGVCIPFNCVDNTQYTFNLTSNGGAVRIGWYAKDGTYISGNTVNAYPATITSPQNAKQGTFALYSATSNKQATFTNVTINQGTTASYTPAKPSISYPIPAEVRALEGYGWSAGTAYNYVDFERKVFVKNVGAVDLGDMSWTKSTSEGHELFYTAVSGIKMTSTTSVAGNIACSAYVNKSYGGVYGHAMDKIVGVSNSSNRVAIYDTSTLSLTSAQFKTAMSGVYLYYELATPVETDISQYLTDNLIEVGAGGTITFPNQNGADYHIPVPSTETYMIDLQEAVANG